MTTSKHTVSYAFSMFYYDVCLVYNHWSSKNVQVFFSGRYQCTLKFILQKTCKYFNDKGTGFKSASMQACSANCKYNQHLSTISPHETLPVRLTKVNLSRLCGSNTPLAYYKIFNCKSIES